MKNKYYSLEFDSRDIFKTLSNNYLHYDLPSKEYEHEINNVTNKIQLDYARSQGLLDSVSFISKIFMSYLTSDGFFQEFKDDTLNIKKSRSYLSVKTVPICKVFLIIAMLIGSSIISYLFSSIVGRFWTALEEKNQKMFHEVLLYYLIILLISCIINFIRSDLSMQVQLDLRMWLTDIILNQYYSDLTYYKFATNKVVDNPDQRIGEDIAQFSSHLLLLICRCIDNIFDFVVYSVLLYKTSVKLFATALIYSIIGTLITAKYGIEIIVVKVAEKKLESDFRYSIVRVRENSENVAMYGGSKLELDKHRHILSLLFTNQTKKRILESRMEFFSNLFRYLIRILPISVVSRDYFNGKIQLGKINQGAMAFNSVVEDVSILVNTFREISNLLSSVDRMGHFIRLLNEQCIDSKFVSIGERIIDNIEKEQLNLKLSRNYFEEELYRQLYSSISEIKLNFCINSINSLEHKHKFSIEGDERGKVSLKLIGKIRSVIWSEKSIKIENLCVNSPDSNGTILRNINLLIKNGERVLILGDSGVGKSSLLRAICGIWNEGSGKICRPPLNKMLFIPQRPYCTHASFREQLLYPFKPSLYVEKYSNKREFDSYLIKILEDVGLKYIFDRFDNIDNEDILDIVRDWSTILSLGEQQRLAFARVIILNPQFCFLDEATSALDVNTEAILYSILNERKSLTYVSIGHRPSIEKFHNKRVLIRNNGGIVIGDI